MMSEYCKDPTKNISVALEELKLKFLSCEDMHERASLRSAIRHLRSSQELLNPDSNLRRSRRNYKRVDQPVLNDDVARSSDVSDNVLQHQKNENKSNKSEKDFTPTFAKPAFTSASNDKAGEETDKTRFERKYYLDQDQHKSRLFEDLEESHATASPSVSLETGVYSYQRKSQNRSSLSHILKIKPKTSKEAEVAPPPAVPLPTPEDEKDFPSGKRRFSKRFRRRSGKAFSDSVEKNFSETVTQSHTTPTVNGTNQSLSARNQLINSPVLTSSPAPPNPTEPTVEGKSNNQNNNSTIQRKRSAHVIRRAIDRIFTPKHKLVSRTEELPQAISSTNKERLGNKTSCHGSLLNTKSNKLKSRNTHITTITKPCIEKNLFGETNMAKVLQPTQDVDIAQDNQVLSLDQDVEEKAIVNNEKNKSENKREVNKEAKNDIKRNTPESSVGLFCNVTTVETGIANEAGQTDERLSFDSYTSSVAATVKSSTSIPPWAPENVNKSSFKTVRRVIPPTQQVDSAPCGSESLLSYEKSNSNRFGEQHNQTTSNSRFKNRELSSSFRISRPSTYIPPDHVKSRSGSFRLLRPKHLIQASSPDVSSFSSGAKLKPENTSALANRQSSTPHSFTLNKDLSLNLSPVTPLASKSDSHSFKSASLQRSESCKENYKSFSKDNFDSIPVSQGNRNRSQRILNRVLSLKIDSEKAILRRQHQQRQSPLSASSLNCENSSEDTLSLTPSSVNPVKQNQINLVSNIEAEPSVSSAENILSEIQPTDTEEKEVTNVLNNSSIELISTGEDEHELTGSLNTISFEAEKTEKVQTAEQNNQIKSSDIESSFDFKKFLNNLLDQVEIEVEAKHELRLSSPIEESNSSVSSSTKVSSPEILTVSETKNSNSNFPSYNSENNCLSEISDLENSGIVKEGSCTDLLPDKELSSSDLCEKEKLLESLEDICNSSSSESGSEILFENELEMEAKYPSRNRGTVRSGSVKLRIQATESRITSNKSSDLKRNHSVLDSKMFRHSEGIKSRMNKFSSVVSSSSTGDKLKTTKMVIKDSNTKPDSNNNINENVVKMKGKTQVEKTKIKPSTANSETTTQPVKSAILNNGPVVNGDHKKATSPLSSKEIIATAINNELKEADSSATEKVEKKLSKAVERGGTINLQASMTKVVHLASKKNVRDSIPFTVNVGTIRAPQDGSTIAVIVNGVAAASPSLSRGIVAKTEQSVKQEVNILSPKKEPSNLDSPAPQSISTKKQIDPISDSRLVSNLNDVSEEKSSLIDAKPSRTRRRRSSNKESPISSSNPNAPSLTTPTVSTPEKLNLEISGASDTLEVPIKAPRRRRRVRKSTDATSTGGSSSSTPDRETSSLASPSSPNSPFTIVLKSNPTELSSPDRGSAKMSDVFMEPSQEMTNGEILVTSIAGKSDGIEREIDVVKKENKGAYIRVEQVRSNQVEEKNRTGTITRQIVEATNTIVVESNKKSLIESESTEIKEVKVEMAPQMQPVVRFTMDNLDQCHDENILMKMLEQTVNVEVRKKIHAVLQAIRKKSTESNESKPRDSSVSYMNSEKTVITNKSGLHQVTQIIRSNRTVSFKNDSSNRTFNANYLTEKYSLDEMSSEKKKIGSIFDREGEPVRRATTRTNQSLGRRELVRNKSMPSSSAKDARKLFIAKLEGESATKSSGRKVGRSATFVVPNAKNVKQMLLKWCQSKTRNYENVDITNFSRSWADGLAFCALVHNFFPDSFDYSQLDEKNRAHNFELAFTTAEKLANADPLLDVEDMIFMGDRPDSKCVFTYVQSLYNKLRKFEKPLEPLSSVEKPNEEKNS